MINGLGRFAISDSIKKKVQKDGGIDVDREFLKAATEVAGNISYSEDEKSRLEEIKKLREIVNTGSTVIVDDIEMIETLAELEFQDFLKEIRLKDYSIGVGRAGDVRIFNKGKNGVILPSIFCYKITKHSENPELNKSHMEQYYLSQLFQVKDDIISNLRLLFNEYKSKIASETDDDKWNRFSRLQNLPCFKNMDSFRFCPMPLEYCEDVDGVDYLFMERIRGLSIEDFIKTIKEMVYFLEVNKIDDFIELVKQKNITKAVLEGFISNEMSMKMFEYILDKMIKAMHDNNVCHRDLHEGNIMINLDNMLPSFIDFGESGFMFNGGNTEDDPYVYEVNRKFLVLGKEEYALSGLSEEKIKSLKAKGAVEKARIISVRTSTDEVKSESALTKLKECVINDGAKLLELIQRRGVTL